MAVDVTFYKWSFAAWDWALKPLNVLVAMPYRHSWESFLAANPQVRPARTMLDSGAYSAWKSGKVIDIEDLIQRSCDPAWTETVGLDVIGSGEGTRQNLDRMRAAGSPAMPVFHIGDDWALLDHYAAHWPKVGLSCRFGEPEADSLRFYDRCFARHWPLRYHSFGWTQRDVLLRFPFHSADSSSWQMAAGVYRSIKLKGRTVRAQGSTTEKVALYLETHIADVLRFQDQLRQRWRRELAGLP
jgi:hypothetical protein